MISNDIDEFESDNCSLVEFWSLQPIRDTIMKDTSKIMNRRQRISDGKPLLFLYDRKSLILKPHPWLG